MFGASDVKEESEEDDKDVDEGLKQRVKTQLVSVDISKQEDLEEQKEDRP